MKIDELIDKAKELLTEFVWGDCMENVRCLFVAACIMDSIEADTYEADRIVGELYEKAYFTEPVEKEDFYNFLVETIV